MVSRFSNSTRNVNIEISNKLEFWSIIHIKIKETSKKRFDDEYYTESVYESCKLINNTIKQIHKAKSGDELDGYNLVQNALGSKRTIVFNQYGSQSEKDEQDGYRDIFCGVMKGIRNPKSHEMITITKERAIHFLFLLSLLMYKIDERI